MVLSVKRMSITQNILPKLPAGAKCYRYSQLPKGQQRLVQPLGRLALTMIVAPRQQLNFSFDSLPLGNQPIAFIISPGSDAVITEHGSGFRRVIVQRNSRAHYFINANSGIAPAFSYQADLEPSSVLHWYLWGRSDIVSDGTISINQSDGSAGYITGGLIAEQASQLKLRLINHHRGRRSRGNVDLKVASRGNARITIDGLIRVSARAAFTDSYLTQDGLMLSSGSEIRLVPNLEIINNEVKASHSATVGRLDPNALHYLTSRGLTPAQASRLLVRGFFNRLLAQIEQPGIRAAFGQLTSTL